jgi:hypothetical protein
MPISTRMAWPYPLENSESWYESFRSMVEAQDASGYAAREDRNLILAGGGTVTWDGSTSLLTWTDYIDIISPISGFKVRIAAGSITIAADQLLYLDLVRAPTRNISTELTTGSQIPTTDTALLLAVRVGADLYWRNGLLLLSGTSVSGLGAGGSKAQAHSIIVGNSVNGDHASVCDYLDAGDGVQLQAALAAASAGADVFIRPGTYDLGAGAATAPLVIPDEVSVRGAGRKHVTIVTKTTDQGAWQVGEDSTLMDVGIEVALPTGACAGQTAVVLLEDNNAKCTRVGIEFAGVYTGAEAGNSILVAGYGCHTAGETGLKIQDCTFGTLGTPAPSFVTLGKAIANGLRAVLVPTYVGAGRGAEIIGLEAYGGDIGAEFDTASRISNFWIRNTYQYGLWMKGTYGSQINEGYIQMDAGIATAKGIYLDAAFHTDIDGVGIQADTGGAGTHAVGCVGAGNNIIRAVRSSPNWAVGIDLDATSDNNIVMANQVSYSSSGIADAGAGNDVAHNIV